MFFVSHPCITFPCLFRMLEIWPNFSDFWVFINIRRKIIELQLYSLFVSPHLHYYMAFTHSEINAFEGKISEAVTVISFIRCTVFLYTPQLDNRQLQYWNINFYLMLEWRNCMGIRTIVFSHCVTTMEAIAVSSCLWKIVMVYMRYKE